MPVPASVRPMVLLVVGLESQGSLGYTVLTDASFIRRRSAQPWVPWRTSGLDTASVEKTP
jgi:hypothetical protein